MTYHNRIMDLRTDADKTQLEIAKILHCQREVYRRYEKAMSVYSKNQINIKEI